MRKNIKNAIGETVQGMLDAGLGTSFSEKELKTLGVEIPQIKSVSSAKIKKIRKIRKIRKKTNLSQSVFARLLNVNPSSVRQWEQGKRSPNGSAKVLLDLLDRKPDTLNYRIKNKKNATLRI